jgi:hypothetical protein
MDKLKGYSLKSRFFEMTDNNMHAQKNSVESSEINAEGNVHIGDVNSTTQQIYVAQAPEVPRRKMMLWVGSLAAAFCAGLTYLFNSKPQAASQVPKIHVVGDNNIVNDMSGSNQTIIKKQEDSSSHK